MAKKLYEILGVGENATTAEIRKAYKQEALKNHPDKVSADKKEEAEEKFKEINQAHETLSNEDTRKAYDAGLINDKGQRVQPQSTSQNASETGGTTKPEENMSSGPGGSTSGPGGSTSGPGGSTSGPGGSTSGPGGSTSGPGGSTSGPGGSTSTSSASKPTPSASNPDPSASTPGPSASTPGPSASTPTSDAPEEDGPGLLERVSDSFAESRARRKKEADEAEKTDTTKMDPMMAMYTQLGESIGRLDHAVKDAGSMLAQKLVDKLIERGKGNDVDEPKADAPKADAPPQANNAEPEPQQLTNGEPGPQQLTNGEPEPQQLTNGEPEPQQLTNGEPEPQSTALMTPFPDTPEPNPSAALEKADTSAYDAKALALTGTDKAKDKDLEVASQVSLGM